MSQLHGTTIVCVRRNDQVVIGGDGQVTMGDIVMKRNARKVRRLYNGRVIAGFAGGTADAFTLFERFEGKLEKHSGNLVRAAVELTKDWRTDRVLRRLEALLVVADATTSLLISGSGDVIEPEDEPDRHRLRRGLRRRRRARAPGQHRAGCPHDRRKGPQHRRRSVSVHQSHPHHRRAGQHREPVTAMTMTPREIVEELDKHIIGQAAAKRAVAIALRNRWRRSQVAEELRNEITPKNILMIGPTGVGKTEIARRLAKLANAPFIKVEATKFTEVGYVGRDVESIIRDLADISVKMTREDEMKKVRHKAEEAAEERILEPAAAAGAGVGRRLPAPTHGKSPIPARCFRQKLREGELDDREIDVELSIAPMGVEIMAPPGMEDMTSQLQSLFQNMGSNRTHTRRLRIKEAYKLLCDEEAGKLVNEEDIKASAVTNVEQNGIVFLDEMDKIARRAEHSGPDVSREGVQRDLLPLVEGCTVSTKFGMVKTDHILFISSGAFHLSKPSDLIPELQGRLPIRVELDALTVGDFVRILTEPDASLTEQYTALHGGRGHGAAVRSRRHRAHRRDRLAGQRAHGEHRRTPAAHGHGAPAGDAVLRGPGHLRADRAHRCRLRE